MLSSTIEQKTSATEVKISSDQKTAVVEVNPASEQKTTAEEVKATSEKKTVVVVVKSASEQRTIVEEVKATLEQKLKSIMEEPAIKALIKLANESRAKHCDPDAFDDERDGYAKIICNFRDVEPAVLKQRLMLMLSVMQKEDRIPADEPLILASQSALKCLEGKSSEDSLTVITEKTERTLNLDSFYKEIKPLESVVMSYDKDKKFEHHYLHHAFASFSTKELNRRLLSNYNYILLDPTILKDHPVLKALKKALDLYPNAEKNTDLHLAILGQGPWFHPDLTSLSLALMSKDLDLNAKNADGNTALHMAIKEIDSMQSGRGPGSVDVFQLFTAIKILIQQPRIDLSIKDKDGKSVLDYILQYQDLTLFALNSGKIEPSVKVKNGSLLSYATKNKWIKVFNYLVTKSQLNLNKQGYKFVCNLVRINKKGHTSVFDWYKTLLKNPDFIPFRPLNNFDDYRYNTNIMIEILKHDNIDMLINFLTDTKSTAFLLDTKEFERLEALAVFHDKASKKEAGWYGKASNVFACMRLLFKGFKEIQNNNFDLARKQFDEALHLDSRRTIEYYFENLTQSILSGKTVLDERQSSELLKIISIKCGKTCPKQLAHNLMTLYEGYNKRIEPDLVAAEYFVKSKYKYFSYFDTSECEQEIKRITDKVGQLRDAKVTPEMAFERLIEAAKKERYALYYIQGFSGDKKYMHYELLEIYFELYSKFKPEFINALRYAIIQIPQDYVMSIKSEDVPSPRQLGLFSDDKEPKKESKVATSEKQNLRL